MHPDHGLMAMKIWHQNNPSLLKQLRDQLNDFYPSLHVYIEHQTVFIRGNFPIYDQRKIKVIDGFKVEIMIPNSFPEDMPIVRETGGRIPKIADRHFYPDGRACLFMPEERYKFFPAGITILQFVEGPVKSFFIGQISYEETGKWIFGQRAHGEKGVIDYYKAILDTTDKGIITRFLIYLCKDKVKGHWICYCNSGKKMRNCHFQKLLDTRKLIRPKDANLSLEVMLRNIHK